jgi:hypothetical protein
MKLLVPSIGGKIMNINSLVLIFLHIKCGVLWVYRLELKEYLEWLRLT